MTAVESCHNAALYKGSLQKHEVWGYAIGGGGRDFIFIKHFLGGVYITLITLFGGVCIKVSQFGGSKHILLKKRGFQNFEKFSHGAHTSSS